MRRCNSQPALQRVVFGPAVFRSSPAPLGFVRMSALLECDSELVRGRGEPSPVFASVPKSELSL